MIGCKTVQTEIMIQARPETVWKALADASEFEQWNPVHVKVEGQFEEGTKVKIHLKDNKGKVSIFSATVRRVVPGKQLNQGGGLPGFLTFNHTFRLDPANGGTRLLHSEEFRGIAVPFVNLDWVESAYMTVNEALKKRAEERERQR